MDCVENCKNKCNTHTLALWSQSEEMKHAWGKLDRKGNPIGSPRPLPLPLYLSLSASRTTQPQPENLSTNALLQGRGQEQGK